MIIQTKIWNGRIRLEHANLIPFADLATRSSGSLKEGSDGNPRTSVPRSTCYNPMLANVPLFRVAIKRQLIRVRANARHTKGR